MKFFYILIGAIIYSSLAAQPQTGTVAGSLQSATGKKPIVAATVEVMDRSGLRVKVALSGEDGSFSIDKLPLN